MSKAEKQKLPDIANYDLHPDYHYSSYWSGREYEHKAEFIAIRSIFKKIRKLYRKETLSENISFPLIGTSILDLGAGFGRLVPSYCDYFKNIVLGDYSLKELKDAVEYLKNFDCKLNFASNTQNVFLFGVNAYFLPFEKNLFDVVISVRLSHHIENQKEFIKEVFRVIKPGGFFVLEIANKNNIKRLVKNLLHLDFKTLAKNKIKLKHDSRSSQGLVSEKQGYVFYNFKVSYITRLAKQAGFRIVTYRQVSILRHPFIKRILPISVMVALEAFVQNISRVLNILGIFLTPSVFVVLRKPLKAESNKTIEGHANSNLATVRDFNKELLKQYLICPKHKTPLRFNETTKIFRCPKGCIFKPHGKYVYDLRFPIVTV